MSRRATAACGGCTRAGAVLAAWMLLVASLLAGATGRAVADPTVAFTINDSRVTGSTGLARDTDDGLYWTVNHSGPAGRAFALDASGRVQGTINFRAKIVDVEALQYFDHALYIADIGDRSGDRRYVTVYVLYQPQPDNAVVLYRAYDFAYPDGPHDAKTMLISDSGRIYLVTDEAHGGIYEAPAQPSRIEVNTLTRVGDAPPYVTDGQFLTDGRIALRSYVDVSILDPNRNDRVVARAATPFQPRGESLTQSLDGNSLLIGSEGPKSTVLSIPVPDTMGAAPSPGPSPPQSPAPASPSASPSPSASVSPSGSQSGGNDPGGNAADQNTDVGNSSGPGSGGTLGALLIAAAVAVAAGAGVYLARGRRA